MTRKQALYKALEVITDKEVKSKINEIIDDLPFTKWSEQAIFDSVDQFIIDNKRTPTVADFKKRGLPPHPVIKLRFGITLKEFLLKFYPNDRLCNSKLYYTKTKEEWQDIFILEYDRIKATTSEEYNNKRQENIPSWVTVARMFGIARWLDWLKFCGVTPYRKDRQYIRKTSSLSITGEVNLLKKKTPPFR